MPEVFVGQMTQESASEVRAAGSVRTQKLLPIRDVGEAGPDLVAVNDQLPVALDATACLQARKIRAGARLGESLTPDYFTGENLRQMMRPFARSAAGDQSGSGVIQADEGGVERRGRARTGIFFQTRRSAPEPIGPGHPHPWARRCPPSRHAPALSARPTHSRATSAHPPARAREAHSLPANGGPRAGKLRSNGSWEQCGSHPKHD